MRTRARLLDSLSSEAVTRSLDSPTGFVGAGGLGQLMDQSMKMLNGGEASSILLTFLLLVLLADALSAGLRKLLA